MRLSDEAHTGRTVSSMRRPRNSDIIGTGILVTNLALWWAYTRTGNVATLAAFFAVAAAGLVAEAPIRRADERHERDTARRRHPVNRGRHRA